MTRPTVPYNVVSSLDEKRKQRAGFDKLGVLETPDVDLLAERDRADRSLEALTGEPAPFTPAEARQAVAHEVDAARPKPVAAFKAADRDDLRDVQARLAAVVDEVDRLQVDLAGLGGAT